MVKKAEAESTKVRADQSDGTQPDESAAEQETTPSSSRDKIKTKLYEAELARLQIELVKLQEWIKHEGLTPEPIKLPPRDESRAYVRPPKSDQTFVPSAF